ncbi:VirB8 family protein [Paraburkholderia piptadeniae]|uniref:VirB8 family protein n=1 Tax=Paraburkholderia piptadeniae TaxID=1701573 RepID=A0A1N7SV18_9BURK|nr:type IV secretion system protein [Paraburkholderia piptadeniae]SIT50779.1 VirB8 family protein [Paraburkholderia piptadeniae]
MPALIRQWFAAATQGRLPKPSSSPSVNPEPLQAKVTADERDAVAWYLKQARNFERSKVQAAEERARIADRRSILSGGIALAAVFGMGALGLLRRPNPPAVLRVNDVTGKVDVLPTTANGRVSFTEKTDRHDLHTYVELRESYDWETIQDAHSAVMLMSGDQEKSAYDTFIRGPSGPLKMLKDKWHVIAKVGSITFVGSTAQVFFSRQAIPLNVAARRPDPTYWIATVAFARVNVPEKQDEQDIDPDGFRCTSYTVTRDWTRAPADATPDGGASGAATAPPAGGGT